MRRKTLEQLKQEMLKINPTIEISGVYINNKTPVLCKCKICGHEWSAAPNNLTSGHGCPGCKSIKIIDRQTKSLDEVLSDFRNVHGDKYDYSKVEYVNGKTKVCIICPIHGEFWQTPHSHISDKAGCPKCSQSHGEELIETFLLKQGIEYISQYPIILETNVSNKAFIDFYLPKYNLYIEYNGIQHYVPIEHFGGKLQFEKQQIRDNSVRSYCKNKNIKLLEISYKLSESEVVNVLKGELL